MLVKINHLVAGPCRLQRHPHGQASDHDLFAQSRKGDLGFTVLNDPHPLSCRIKSTAVG
jgi:hypothetical protein